MTVPLSLHCSYLKTFGILVITEGLQLMKIFFINYNQNHKKNQISKISMNFPILNKMIQIYKCIKWEMLGFTHNLYLLFVQVPMISLLLCLTVVSTQVALRYPIGFGVVRVVDPASTLEEFIEGIGLPAQQNEGYNLLSLDGLTSDTEYQTLDSVPCPLMVWKNVYQIISGNKATIHGSSNLQLQEEILQRFHDKGCGLLMHTKLDQAPISRGNKSASTIGASIASAALQLQLDGVSIEFVDYNAVYQNTASDWLQSLLQTIRGRTKEKSEFIIALIIPAPYVIAMKLFKHPVVSSLVDYYILQYYDTVRDDYNNSTSTFQKALYYEGSALFELMTNEDIHLDTCRTLISKPVGGNGSWNTRQFVAQAKLKTAITEAYDRYGWFGGFANMHFSADFNQMFLNAVLGDLRTQCIRYEKCMC